MKTRNKMFMFCLFALLLFSCNNDDDGTPPKEGQPTEVLVQNIRIDGNNGIQSISFEYNLDNTVSKIINSNGLSYTYSYTNGLISKMVFSDGFGVNEYDYEYDTDGILIKITVDGIEERMVAYDPATDTYTILFSVQNLNLELKLKMNSDGDIVTQNVRNIDTDELLDSSITEYANTMKGSAFFSNNVALQTRAVRGDYGSTTINGNYAHKPINTFSGRFNAIFTNEYNENGQLTASEIISDDYVGNISYTYIPINP